MKIYLCNFAIDTNDDTFHINCGVNEKLNIIRQKLIEIQAVLETPPYMDTADHPIRAIFVAPEYFFARSFPEYYLWRGQGVPEHRRGRHYEYGDYEAIRQGLTQLSLEFPKILLIPGTLAWKKPAIPRMANPIPGTNRYAPVPAWPAGSRKNKQQYDDWMKSLGETPTERSWLDYTHEAPDRHLLIGEALLKKDAGNLYGGAGLDVNDKKFIVRTREIQPEKYIEELRKLEFGLAFNTAYFYLDGKKVGEYSKHSDYQEVLFDAAYQDLTVALLTRESPILNIKGLKFGVEICLDHACDVLQNYLSQSRVFFSPDIVQENPDFYLQEAAEAFVRVRKSENCKLKIMGTPPRSEELKAHEGNYILCPDNLYYINCGKIEIVNITDRQFLENTIARERSDYGDANCFTLTSAKVERFIERNGGHHRDQLFYISRETGFISISTEKIPQFDAFLSIEYGPALHINGEMCCPAPPSYVKDLTPEERARCIMIAGVGEIIDHRPDIHLILSASVGNRLPHAKYCWIHSSSQSECNLPKLPYSNGSFSGELTTISPHISRDLFDAAAHGNLDLVRFLICLGADIDSQHTNKNIQSNGEVHIYRGKTPLFIAAEKGRHEVVRFLLEKGANPKIRDCGFWRPYDVALVMEHQYGKTECSPCVLLLKGRM